MSSTAIKIIAAAVAVIGSAAASAAVTTLDGKGFDVSFNGSTFGAGAISLSADGKSVLFDTDALSAIAVKGDNDIAFDALNFSITLDSGYTFKSLEMSQSGDYQLLKKNSEVFASLSSAVSIAGVAKSAAYKTAVFDLDGVKSGANSWSLSSTYNLAGTPYATASKLNVWALSLLSADAAKSGFASIAAHDYSLQVMTAAVPEPEQWALMLAGIGMVGAIARRRSARA
ncbi:PEPxxWA-CTERM sorting domain-containing protein [Niveibacterium sp.]|uniref:PEPxxWA-CTERM sorting domain-containing protein n=1 Tax=Niveibacterium sp. TaxID=2017444 RepID=UPI0035B2F2BF